MVDHAQTVPAAHQVPPIQRPEDFNDYWSSMLTELNASPIEVSVEESALANTPKIPGNSGTVTDAVSVSRLSFASLGGKRPVGWLFKPSQRRPEGALLFLPGYSTACGSELIHTVLAQVAHSGYAVLAVDPRGQGAARNQHPPLPDGKILTGLLDPISFIYRGIVADCVRAAEALTHLTGFERIGVLGHSQGGGLALITASLAPERVGAVGCMIPFLTHFAWSLRHRPSTGPYREVYDFVAEHPQSRAAVERSLGYLDTLHHAPRVQAPILVSVGLKDTTCQPPTVYALFERLQNTRSLLVLPDVGHEHAPDFYHHELAWFRRYLRNEADDEVTLQRLALPPALQ